MEVLDSIPVRLEMADVMAQLRNRAELEEPVRELLAQVRTVARPKAVFDVCHVDQKGPDWVSVNGVRFGSEVLRVNLEAVHRVFPYVATCGREVEAIAVPQDDVMRAYCLDVIKRMLVRSARKHMEEYVTVKYALGQVSRMAPGELKDWPITQQRQLFALFGDVEKLIGVTLTESCLMVPIKSVSGIMFPTETRFESCQLCVHPRCEGRRAPYSPQLAKEYAEKARELAATGS